MNVPRMKSWRDHPVISGQAPNPEVPRERPLPLPPVGRYAVRSFDGRFLVINHVGNSVSTMKVTRRDAEELVERLNAKAEIEERLGRAQRRSCMSCTREFTSEGIHNRLCPYCRALGHSPARW